MAQRSAQPIRLVPSTTQHKNDYHYHCCQGGSAWVEPASLEMGSTTSRHRRGRALAGLRAELSGRAGFLLPALAKPARCQSHRALVLPPPCAR
jgi:hypothetical protein